MRWLLGELRHHRANGAMKGERNPISIHRIAKIGKFKN
jgi:hypothetical protein